MGRFALEYQIIVWIGTYQVCTCTYNIPGDGADGGTGVILKVDHIEEGKSVSTSLTIAFLPEYDEEPNQAFKMNGRHHHGRVLPKMT